MTPSSGKPQTFQQTDVLARDDASRAERVVEINISYVSIPEKMPRQRRRVTQTLHDGRQETRIADIMQTCFSSRALENLVAIERSGYV